MKPTSIKGRNVIGAKLRQIRLAQKPLVTLEDLAGRLAARGVHIDRSAIGRIENNDRHVLDYELRALADALRTDMREFFR